MTAETFPSPLSNGIRIQTDSDKWRNDPNQPKELQLRAVQRTTARKSDA